MQTLSQGAYNHPPPNPCHLFINSLRRGESNLQGYRVCGLFAGWTRVVFIAKETHRYKMITARSETWNLIRELIRTIGVFKDCYCYYCCCCYCKCYLCMILSAHPSAHSEDYNRRHGSFFLHLLGMEGQSYWKFIFIYLFGTDAISRCIILKLKW